MKTASHTLLLLLTIAQTATAQDAPQLPRPELQVYPDRYVPVEDPENQPAFEYIRDVPYSLWEVPLPETVERNAIRNRDEDAVRSDFEAEFSAVFREAAHFPLHAFGSCGRTRLRDAALIYEGMTLAVAKSGEYEVRMVLEAPRRPVVIRMQLEVHEYVQDPRPSGTAPQVAVVPIGTITLAPITLEPDWDAPRHQTSRTHRVRRGGYSHLLREVSLAENSSSYTITRAGTARFGTIPD